MEVDALPRARHRFAFELLAAKDAKREVAHANAAAPTFDELARIESGDSGELRPRAVNLHVDMGRVEAEHARQFVEFDPALRGGFMARMHVGRAGSREHDEAVVMDALAEIDRATANMQQRAHVLFVLANQEVEPLRRAPKTPGNVSTDVEPLRASARRQAASPTDTSSP